VTNGLVQPLGDAAAGGEIDWHAEKVRRRFSQDLCQTGRILGVIPSDDILTSGALEEDDRLDDVGIDAAA
jgi:hypothetical protein